MLLWILARCEGKVDADLTPIGYVPKPSDIDIGGLDSVSSDTLRDLLSVDNASWLADIENIKEFYSFIGDRVPSELTDELSDLEKRLGE